MTWAEPFWRFSIGACVVAIVYVNWFTWLPTDEAVRAGRATADLLLIATTYTIAPLLPTLAWAVRRRAAPEARKYRS